MQFMDEIITFAKSNGNKISYEELSSIFEANNAGKIEDAELDAVMQKIASLNIEFVDEQVVNIDESMEIYYTDNSLRMYLRDIGGYKTLTAEEEIELGKRISEGDEKAKEELTNHNLKLVVSIAKKYYAMYDSKRMDLLELISLGNFGLLAAVEKFDINKKCKFSTYATWWIRQKITRGVSEEIDLIRKPVHVNATIQTIKKYRNKYYQQHLRYPTPEETIEALKLAPSTYENAFKGYSTSSLASLNEPVGDANESDTELGEFIPDPSRSPEEEYEEKNICETVHKALDIYLMREKAKKTGRRKNRSEEQITEDKERNVDIIRYRYGIYVDKALPKEFEEYARMNANGVPLTLEATGSIYGITRERVRQIEEKGLKRLKPIIKQLGLTKETENMQRVVRKKPANTNIKKKVQNTCMAMDIKEARERRLYFDVCSGREKQFYDNVSHCTEVPGEYSKMELLKVMGQYDLLIILNTVRDMKEEDSLMYIFDFNYSELKNIYALIERYEFSLTCSITEEETQQLQQKILFLNKKKLEYKDALVYLEKRIRTISTAKQDQFKDKYGDDYKRTLRKQN